MPYRKNLCMRLSEPVAGLLAELTREEAARLEEIRVRLSRRTELVIGEERRLALFAPDEGEMQDLIAALSGYALYACERQLAEGYLTLPDGHRAGICGRMTLDERSKSHLSGATSVCIRIAKHIDGASIPIRSFLLNANGRPRRVLLLGAPGCGKTTALRDAACFLSLNCGFHVAVADEREELFAPGFACHAPVDVLLGMRKAEAMLLLMRSMSPEILVTDEIGREEDAQAVEEAARCGVGLLVSAHAASIEEAMDRPALRTLITGGALDCCILLGRHGACVDAKNVNQLRKGCSYGDGYGGHGADRRECHGFSYGGRGEDAFALCACNATMSAQNA